MCSGRTGVLDCGEQKARIYPSSPLLRALDPRTQRTEFWLERYGTEAVE